MGEQSPELIVHLITSLQGGGTENFLHQILQHPDPRYRHHVLYLKTDGVIGERISALGIPKTSVSAFSLAHTLAKLQPSILHTCLYRAHQLGRLAGAWTKIPTIVSSQQSIDQWQKPWHAWLDAWTLRYCDAVFVNSSAARQLILKRTRSRTLPIYDVPNGVDWPLALASRTTHWRDKLGLAKNNQLGSALMRLHPEKGADLIFPLAQELLTAHPDLHLLVGGVGPLEEEIRRSIKGQPFESRLHLVGWVDDFAGLMAESDFFWLLSREESTPQVLVEATGLELPWVAPNVGGVKDLLSHGAVGELFAAENIQDAVASFNRLLDRLPERRAQAQQSAPSFRITYSVPAMVKSFYEALDAVSKIAHH